MGQTLRYGKARLSYEDTSLLITPTPVVSFKEVYAEGRYWAPRISDKAALQLLKRKMDKQVSYLRAYRGFRASGAKEERELGEGRAFLRWLMRHELSVAWESEDLNLHPYFSQKDAPKHDPSDEMSRDMSFAIAPVSVNGKKVKLYLADDDVLRLFHMQQGQQEDFLKLVSRYVEQRHQWMAKQLPALPFVEWLALQGHRPGFNRGQIGFQLPF